MKNKVINQIKKIIKDHGSFTTADGPCVGSLGEDIVLLAEHFYSDKVELTIYVRAEEDSHSFVSYESLTLNVLKKILILAKQFER